MKSHILTTRVTTAIARAGFVSAIVSVRPCARSFDALDRLQDARPFPVLRWCHQEAPRRLVDHRHLPFANRFIAMLHASGAASTLQRRGIPHTRHSCECASVPPDPKKRTFCDRHHIASAVCGASLELVDRQRHVRRFFLKTQPRPGGAFLWCAEY
jgi:hypothetical protein